MFSYAKIGNTILVDRRFPPSRAGAPTSVVTDRHDTAHVSRWHASFEEKRPTWWFAVEHLVLLRPSEADAERVFSLLRAAWGEQQESALSDMIKAGLYQKVNEREL